MKNTDLTELMHAVLDGEATPDEAGELERLLAEIQQAMRQASDKV